MNGVWAIDESSLVDPYGKLKVKVTRDSDVKEIEYDISGLTLEPQPQP